MPNIRQASASAAPLSGAGFGGQPSDTGPSVVMSCARCWVCGCRRTDALVLVVDMSRALQALQLLARWKRRGPPQTVNVEHFPGNVDLGFCENSAAR